MKEYQSEEIRNFALLGHASSGKTMLSEAILVNAGIIGRLGSIANGSTFSDYTDEEKKRQISIQTSLMNCDWNGKKLNYIDNPGYLDFISESLGAIRATDASLIVIHSEMGVQIGTDTAWNYSSRADKAKMVAVNALDREHANFDQVLEQINKNFSESPTPLTFPVNPGLGFNQIVDVINMQLLTYQTDGSGKFESAPLTGDLKARAESYYESLVEHIAESDDALTEKFFEEGTLSPEEVKANLHNAFVKRTLIPLFAVSAEQNIGVQPMLNFIADYGASPFDRAPVVAKNSNDEEVTLDPKSADPVVFVFKTINESHVGEMLLIRVFSGELLSGTDLFNTKSNTPERVTQLFFLNGKNRGAANKLVSGDIGAVVKLKNTHTGDTLSLSKKAVTLPPIPFPRPNIHAALSLKAKGEEEKMAVGLSQIHSEDPSFFYIVDPELHQTVISCQGDLHMEVVAEKIRQRYKVDFDLIEPKVPFRETIKGKGEAKYRHKKQSGGAGQFAEVWMRIEPKQRGEGVEFIQSLVGQNVDRSFVPSVEKGVKAACKEGILAGYRIEDVKVDFYDGKMHPVDSKDIAFQIAGKEAFKEAFTAARPCLLEPISLVKIVTPEACMGAVMGDLSSRRGKIQGMEAEGMNQVLKAMVPAMELYRYASALRSLTGGRGIHSEEFSHYEEMPKEMEAKVVAKSKELKAAPQS
jgi:elongation factor G